MDETQLTIKRLEELSKRAYDRNYNTFSEFLNTNEKAILLSLKLPTDVKLFGGFNNANRCVAGFGYDLDDSEYPIKCIQITPLQQKFADDLNHRDFLGSLMNLGIKRNTIGEIIINNNVGYVFCLDNICDYIVDNLSKISHTNVKCQVIDEIPILAIPQPIDSEMFVSSLRIDVIICSVFNLSRNECNNLFLRELIYINSKSVTKSSYTVSDNDVISVSGYGKFIFNNTIKSTRKNRLVISVGLYK